MKRFEDKAILVTGAGSGIGRATAQRLAEEGGRVACLDIDEANVAETVKSIGGDALALTCDISDEAQVAEAVATVVDKFGKLNVLVNVAGILRADKTHELSLDDWSRIINVNLTGTFLMCRAALPHLLEHKGSAIVNTASTAALGAHPWMAAYAASKGGIVSMSRTMAIEYAKAGLRVNCVCPGGVVTPLHGQFRMPSGVDGMLLKRTLPIAEYGQPEQIAGAIAFLASDDAGYTNGEEIRIDGGALA